MIKVIILIAIITLGVITCSSNSGKALIDAAMDGNFEKVKLLIEKGADIDAKDNDGVTALMYVSRAGDLEIAKYLVENGADVNAKDKEGWSVLMEASYEGHLKVVKYLIENGKVNVNSKDDDGWNALMRASWRGYSEIVKYLVKNGADINIKNNDGKTALDWADTEEIKEVLRKTGAK